MTAWIQNRSQGTILCPSVKIVLNDRRSALAPRRFSHPQRRRPADAWSQEAGCILAKPLNAFKKDTHYPSSSGQWKPLHHVIHFGQEAVLILVPVVIVGIPWVLEHWQLVLIVTAVVYLGPFGSVLSGFLQPKAAGPTQPFWKHEQASQLLRPVIDIEVSPDKPSANYSSRPLSERSSRHESPLSTSGNPSFVQSPVRRAQRAPVRRRVHRSPAADRGSLQQAPVEQSRDEKQSIVQNVHYWRVQKERKSVWVALFSRLPFIRRWGGFL